MIAYLLIALMSVLIFLCFSDAVPTLARATAEWQRGKIWSHKNAAR
jgi:hypothetical protein